jgi:hypothetical protein
LPVANPAPIDITKVKAGEGAMAEMISRAWTTFRLKSEGWFVLRIQPDGKHQIEFPE